jgi:hypothetical protein
LYSGIKIRFPNAGHALTKFDQRRQFALID